MGSASEHYRAQCDPIWQSLHEHPFITELAEGTLPLEKFRFFMEQDILYLVEFARCLAMGAAKSRNERELRYFTTDLNQVIDAEIQSNRDLLARVIEMGAADRGGSLAMAPKNVAYTSYMLAIAHRGGPLEIMASLLPCAWSYVEIAGRLAERTDAAHPVYADWIGYFTLPTNVAMVADMRADFDEIVATEAASDETHAQIGEIFAMASRLEGGFWEMSYELEQWPDLDLKAASSTPRPPAASS